MKQKLFKITNKNHCEYYICAKEMEDAIVKFNKLLEKYNDYEKEIIKIEFIDYILGE